MSVNTHPTLGELYLIPNLLGDAPVDASLPPLVASVVNSLRHFVVEDEKNARRFIKQLCPEKIIRELSIEILNEHTKQEEVERLVLPLRNRSSVGIISEAGCPGIADPGAELVKRAHEIGVRVHPLVGPCSMTLALMASGLNGQRWRFLGYLPIDSSERKAQLQEIEHTLHRSNETQIFMDTPYRNQRLFEEILVVCRPETLLCVASALTTGEESIQVKSVHEWRKHPPTLPKSPALFILGK